MKTSTRGALVVLAVLGLLLLGVVGWKIGSSGQSSEQPSPEALAQAAPAAAPGAAAGPTVAVSPAAPAANQTDPKLAPAGPAKRPVFPGLVHRYTFNDGTADDSVGKAHGTLEGGATIANGQLVLDGAPRSSSRVTLPSSGEDSTRFINMSHFEAVTVQCWFTFNSPIPNANTYGEFFSFGGTGAATGYGYLYIMGVARDGWSGGKTRAVIENAPEPPSSNFDPRPFESQAIGQDPITDQLPHQFTMTIDDKNIAYYLDGKLIDSAPLATTASGPTTLSVISNQRAQIGASVWLNDPSFAGKIDEFSIYDRALTAEDVLRTFQTGPEEAPDKKDAKNGG